MTKLDYAEDLYTLWRQYERQQGERPKEAAETLRNIIGHCQAAIDKAGPSDYFEDNKRKAERELIADGFKL